MSKDTIERHFSAAAQQYDQYALVQKKMSVQLMDLLVQQAKPFKKILEIGCGTGILTRQLAASFPKAEITATDLAENMLTYTSRRLADYGNISYQQLDGEKLTAVEEYDLVVANAVFQWFTNYQEAFQRIYKSLKGGGCLAYATFGKTTFCELQNSCQQAYRQNNLEGVWHNGPLFKSQEELVQLTEKSGFRVYSYSRNYYEYHDTVKGFLKSIKKVGANNSAADAQRIISRKVMFDMLEHYEQHYRTEQGIQATNHIVFVVAQK